MTRSPQTAALTLALAALILAAAPARADRLKLTSGRVIEGQILAQTEDTITVKTDAGITVTFGLEMVLEIERAKTPLQRYEARRAALGEDLSAAQHRELARLCVELGLEAEAAPHWQGVLAAQPEDAEAHRGLDHIQHEGRWMSRDDYMAGLGLVRWEGRWVSEPERDMLEAAEAARAGRSKARRLVHTAATHKDEERRDEAAEALAALPNAAVRETFRRELIIGNRAERRLVLDEVARRPDDALLRKALARTALADPVRVHRQRALEVLESRKDPETATYFTSALMAESPILRINAANALLRFPDVRAVPRLIATLRFESGGFGRAHIVNFTQRAYIKDFEISSGGTGQVIGEVADPVVGGFSEGTVLDAHVIKVEWESKAQVLESLTGQSFGTNQGAWLAWWRKTQDEFQLTPGAQARRDGWLASRD